jgi:hypothetical protein
MQILTQLKHSIIIFFIFCWCSSQAQIKILFDASKAQSAGNADWVVDANSYNISYSTGNPVANTGGNEANPSRYPTPAQTGITSSTTETYWKGGLSAWGLEAAQAGYLIETLPIGAAITYGNTSNPQDLSNYKVFVVVEPNILFSTAEKTAILQFVFNGGGLMLVGNHDGSDRNNDGSDSRQVWNDLMSNNSVQANPFGFSFDAVSISQTTSNIMNNPSSDPVMNGSFGVVSQMQYAAGATMTMNPTQNASIKGLVYRTGSAKANNNVMALRCVFGVGRVVAIGDSSPCDDGTGDTNDTLYDGWFSDASGNHRIFLMNATAWLAASTVLPIELLDFKGIAQVEGNKLDWTIEKTTTLLSVVIERSVDAEAKFQTIAQINPIAGQTRFEYFDAKPSLSNLYRLKFIENDGTLTYSKIIALAREFDQVLMRQRGQSLFITPLRHDAILSIYSLGGQLIRHIPLSKQAEEQIIDISYLDATNYIATLLIENNLSPISIKLNMNF